MNLGSKACEVILRILKDQEVCAVDIEGLFGGLVATWNPILCTFKSFNTIAGILLEGKVHGIKKIMHFMNINAPYKDLKYLQDKVNDSGLLSLKNLVIVGDLNMTLHYFENQGTTSPIDPLSDY